MTTRERDHSDVPAHGDDQLLPGDGTADPVAPDTAGDVWWPKGRGAWARFAVPPVAAFLLAQVVLYVAAIRDHTTSGYFTPGNWARWDSGNYLSIAAHGYSFTPCNGPQFAPHSVCGTVGWSPLYPWLIAGLGHLGVSLPYAGMVLSWLFACLTLQALWVLIRPEWSFSKLCCLAFAACFPGMVYAYALFPISLLTFLTVVCLLLFIRRHFLLAGLVGAVCAFAFSTGPLVAAVLLVAALLVERGPRLWRVVVESAGVAFAGFGLFLLYDQWQVGDWKATLQVQSDFANGLHDPIVTFLDAFTGGSAAKYIVQSANPGYAHTIPKAQTAFLALLVIGLVAWTLWRRPVGRTEWLLLSYTVIVWLLPLVDGPTLSRYRVEALLVPCVALCTRLPRPVLLVLLGTSVWLALGLAPLFSSSILI